MKRDADGGVLSVLDNMKVTGKRKAGRPNETKGDTEREEDEDILGVGGSVTAA